MVKKGKQTCFFGRGEWRTDFYICQGKRLSGEGLKKEQFPNRGERWEDEPAKKEGGKEHLVSTGESGMGYAWRKLKLIPEDLGIYTTERSGTNNGRKVTDPKVPK